MTETTEIRHRTVVVVGHGAPENQNLSDKVHGYIDNDTGIHYVRDDDEENWTIDEYLTECAKHRMPYAPRGSASSSYASRPWPHDDESPWYTLTRASYRAWRREQAEGIDDPDGRIFAAKQWAEISAERDRRAQGAGR